jgi:hypothetical protein
MLFASAATRSIQNLSYLTRDRVLPRDRELAQLDLAADQFHLQAAKDQLLEALGLEDLEL